MAGYKWLPCIETCSVSPEMIVAGIDQDGAKLVVGRAVHDEDLLPAKAKPEHGVAYVVHDGKEHMKHQFEILVSPGASTRFDWILAKSGNVPEGAVVGGKTSTGEKLFVGRGTHNSTTSIGKVHPSHGCIYIPFAGTEVMHPEYEVLVEK